MSLRDFAPTLWDLLGLAGREHPRRPRLVPRPAERDAQLPPHRRPGARPTMKQRYDDLVVEMKGTYRVRVNRWRSSMSGCAWVVRYEDGRISRLIEAPYPRGPVSCAVFLHEIGHHAIGWDTHRLRCVEEYDAWRWALDMMRTRGLNVTSAVERRMAESVRYAIRKAQRRGLKRLPEVLLPYT